MRSVAERSAVEEPRLDDPFAVPPERGTAERQLATLHDLHGRALYHFLVRSTLGDRRLAEDIHQETFLRAWKHLVKHHDTDLAAFRPWLYTVARRLVIDMLRHSSARPTEVSVNDLAQASVSEDSIDRHMNRQEVLDKLMQLRPEHRMLLIELYHHGRTAAEVAEVLGIPVGTVKSRTFYAKRALRAILAE